jgi:hypothetical protein
MGAKSFFFKSSTRFFFLGKGRLTHDFAGPLASRNPHTGNNSKPIGFRNRFDAFDKRKNDGGFEHENNFQEVNQQNSSTRFFFKLSDLICGIFLPINFGEDIRFFLFLLSDSKSSSSGLSGRFGILPLDFFSSFSSFVCG